MRGRPLCLVCLIFILFCGRFQVSVPADSIFCEGKQKMDITLTGQVYRIVETSEYQLLYLKNNSIYFQNQSYFESHIFVYDKEFHKVKIGNQVQVTGEANAFQNARNTGNFNVKEYYGRQGFYGSVYGDTVTVLSNECAPIRQGLHHIKQLWSNQLEQNLGEKECGIMQAILLGEKQRIDADIKDLYQANGISHILAISGLHITFIGMGIYKIIRKSGMGLFLAGVLSLTILAAYVWMTGMSVSSLRAFLMLAIHVGAGICGRTYDMPTSWFLSGAILVGWKPEYLMDAGFILSFIAVAGVIFVAPVIRKLFPKLTATIKGFDVSVGVWLALFPILLSFYFEFPTYSIIINLLLVPFITVLLVCGIVGSGLCMLSIPLGQIFLRVCEWILQFFEWSGHLFEKLPGANIVCGKVPLWFLVLFYGCLVLALFTIYLRKTERQKMGRYLILLFLGLVLLSTKCTDRLGKMQIVFLDVGQGDCIFIKGPTGKTYLIDGGSSDVSEVGKYRIVPFLKSQGISTLDYVFVTHGDFDHYSGIKEMLELDIAIERIVFSAAYKQDMGLRELGKVATEKGISIYCMLPGEEIVEDKLFISCLHPKEAFDCEGGNESSLVLSVAYIEWDVLLTGDVEEEGEKYLSSVLAEQEKTYEVLKVAHHGSKNSTTEDFLSLVRPQLAIISAGQNNSYGHPHEETISRLKNSACEIINTAECGEIRIVIYEDGANLLTFI